MPLVLKAEPRVAIQLSAAEQRIYDAYRQAFAGIGDINDSRVLRAIEDAINANNPLGAVNAVAWGDFAASLQKTVDALNKEVIKAANDSARTLPASVRIAANFTTADPRAIAFAQQRAGKLIRQVSDESRKAVTETIMEALRMRIDRREMVTRISKVVGLDSRQARALTRFYEKSLADGRAAGLDYEEALAKADRLGDKYKKRLIRQRAVRIARTETVAASNAGRYLSWIEAEAQGLLGSTSVKRWITAIDERTCPICAPLNNKEVPYKTNFSTGELMPPVHPNCRCSAVIIPAEVSFIPLEKAVVSSDPIAAMFKHGTHDQSSHNPHKGGKGGTSAELLDRMTYQRRQGFWSGTVPDEQDDALFSYTTNSYLNMQSVARTGETALDGKDPEQIARITKANDNLDALIDSAPPLPSDLTTYRGIQGDIAKAYLGAKAGDVITDTGFSSTSLLREKAELYIAQPLPSSLKISESTAMLEVISPAKTRGIMVDGFNNDIIASDPIITDYLSTALSTRTQYEWLLNRGTSFEVVSVKGSTVKVKVKNG